MKAWKAGEEKAAGLLEEKGYTIMEKNYRDRRGEIDIVARNGDTLVFVEVKTWSGAPFEDLEVSLSRRKRKTIIRESKRYLFEHSGEDGIFVRYDLMFVDPESGEIEHIEDAFTETGAV